MTERASINLDNLIDLGSFEVSAAEKEQYGRELADFLEYARVINGAPQHLPPASHAVEREQLLRNDSAAPFPEREALMANAPALQGTSYLVPPLAGSTGATGERDAKAPRSG
ncbi:MAG TPA: Asp-tRNA(Asn)/Glu-tRNA(Gln) amidotransferase subunit GatC, partial [Spirochaetota bacterium]|nr:Asp-tRNA(Asn)/Glu-tRNA(Gln) amidotransferase subunit GatC [Spirochaetota bacterium]